MKFHSIPKLKTLLRNKVRTIKVKQKKKKVKQRVEKNSIGQWQVVSVQRDKRKSKKFYKKLQAHIERRKSKDSFILSKLFFF